MKLSKCIDAFSMISQDIIWINKKTGEVYFSENLDEDQIMLDEDLIVLPFQIELRKYNDMVEFAENVRDFETRQKLFRALRGKGAFRRFKNTVFYCGL